MSLPKPEAVFFDWDGTLVDSFELLHAAHNYAQGKLGLPLMEQEEFSGYFGQPREKLYVKMYGNQGDEAKKHFETYVFDNHIEGVKAIIGAQDVLESFERLNIPCGIVSNKRRVLIEAEIKNLGWERFFNVVVGAGDAEEDKPSPAPLRHGMEKAGYSFPMEGIWFVGDTDNDLLCAEQAGCKSILIAQELEAADLLAKHEVHLHKNNCTELVEFLLQYDAERLKSNQ